jgi:DNA polymerase III alpha subunit
VRPAPQGRRERDLLDDAKRVGVRPVASVAAHFAAPAGHAAFRLLAVVKKRAPVATLPPGVVAPAHHLAEPREAAERFRDVPEAMANALQLAERCRSDVLPRGRAPLPARVPQGQTAFGYLKLLCERAFPGKVWEDEGAARRRLERELSAVRLILRPAEEPGARLQVSQARRPPGHLRVGRHPR